MIDKLIDIAKGEIGISEPFGDDKYISYYNGRYGTKFSKNVPWCAIFVTWCKSLAGIDEKIIPHFASCDAGMKWFKNKDLWQKSKGYKGKYIPKKGDIIFFSSKYTENDSTHVGIVVGVSGESVITVEGNASDKVLSRSYSQSSAYIIGYGTPKYDKYETYIVKKGDSLWEIAEKKLGNGREYTRIMELNNLKDTVIFPGQRINIP